MIAISNFYHKLAVFRFKSRAWQLGLTAGLLLFTYLFGMTRPVAGFEYDLFLYILDLQPADRDLVAASAVRAAPQWSVIGVYALILAFYVARYTRSRTTAVSILTVVLFLFGLLMLEVLLAVFLQVFLPIMFPVLVMLLVSLSFWSLDLYQRFAASLSRQDRKIDLSDVQARIESGNLKSAMRLLRQCPYSDDLLEVGYELGMQLEAGKHWASALYLYHWLSQFDPGLGDFVTRIEEIRNQRRDLLKQGKSRPEVRSEAPMIGNYRLIRKIAKGSTSVMYEANDTRSGNRVALKVMKLRFLEQKERVRARQWLQEAVIVAQLDHDNIVKIHDAEILGDNAYIAMDYISGYSMSARLRRREYLTVGECIRISRDMLRALAVAHGHGVVHGDIKPANIMYDTANDTYILTDFGAAYTGQREGKSAHVIVGTPAYMSPEQLQGRKLDGRSDLFSLAVTLYHLLTGHQPFEGDSLPELKKRIMGAEPDLSHLTLPAGITEVIIKALQKKPYMRFADAQQMLTSVEYCESQLRERMKKRS
ncbi:MAG: serine/threonine-protein kinase [Gammaproteobacteria bacterium]|jgi:serine/threonine-protein kinase